MPSTYNCACYLVGIKEYLLRGRVHLEICSYHILIDWNPGLLNVAQTDEFIHHHLSGGGGLRQRRERAGRVKGREKEGKGE